MRRILVIIIIINIMVSSAYATNSIPSADPNTIGTDIKTKLKELQKEIASKAAKLKQEISNKLTDKAYVGKVQTKGAFSITLASNGGPKIVSLNQDTILPKKKIAQEDYLAALGDVDETGVLTAKKVVLLPPATEQKTFLWGQIISVSEKLATLKDKDFKNVAVSLSISSKVRLNDFVILTGRKGKNDIFESEFVYVIPQGGIIKPKKVATPSARP